MFRCLLTQSVRHQLSALVKKERPHCKAKNHVLTDLLKHYVNQHAEHSEVCEKTNLTMLTFDPLLYLSNWRLYELIKVDVACGHGHVG